MQNYQNVATQFTDWVKQTHGCRTLDEARAHTGEYLDQRQAAGLSSWTVRRDAAALGKLYQCKTTALGAELPTRNRGNITQHRTPPREYSEANHQALADFCRSCGLRRSEVADLKPSDVRMEGGRCLVTVQHGKGGKARTVTALNDTPARMAAAAEAAGRDRVIDHIPVRAPIHEYRADFAQAMYNNIARPIDTIDPREKVVVGHNKDGSERLKSARYCGRADKAGSWYDRKAMLEVSQALGHNRDDVVLNYVK